MFRGLPQLLLKTVYIGVNFFVLDGFQGSLVYSNSWEISIENFIMLKFRLVSLKQCQSL